VIQLIGGQDDAAKCDAPADCTRACTRNRDRGSISICSRKGFRDLFDALSKNDAIRVSITDETGVGQK